MVHLGRSQQVTVQVYEPEPRDDNEQFVKSLVTATQKSELPIDYEGSSNKVASTEPQGWLIQQLVNRFHNAFNIMGAVVGGTGIGKSYLTARLAQVVTYALNEHQKACYQCRIFILQSVCKCRGHNPCGTCIENARMGNIIKIPWSSDQVVFDPVEFFELLDVLPGGAFIIIDEAGVGLNAQKWMSAINEVFSYAAETMRFRRISVIFCAPDLSMVTINVRRVLRMLIRVYGRGYARVYKLRSNAMGRQWLKGLGILKRVPKPDQSFIDPYEERKSDAFEVLKKYCVDKLKGMVNNKKSNPYNYQIKGGISESS